MDRISIFRGVVLAGEKGASKLLLAASSMLVDPVKVSGSSGIVSRDNGLLPPLRTDSGDLTVGSLSPATEAAFDEAGLGVVGVVRDLAVLVVVLGLVVVLDGRFAAVVGVEVAPPIVVLLLLSTAVSVLAVREVEEVVGVCVRDRRRLSGVSAALPSSVVLRADEAVGRVAADGAFAAVVEVREDRVLDLAVDGDEAGLAVDELSRDEAVAGFFLSSVDFAAVLLAGVLAPVVLDFLSIAFS